MVFMMKKNLLFVLIIILLFSGCSIDKKVINENGDNKVINSEKNNYVNVLINNKKYVIELYDSEDVLDIINSLPNELILNDLNGNEKYVYLDNSLPTKSYYPKRINAGDVMLYGDNCLVIFYKSFDTPYSYTKIGHISDLGDLGSDSINVKFEK